MGSLADNMEARWQWRREENTGQVGASGGHRHGIIRNVNKFEG